MTMQQHIDNTLPMASASEVTAYFRAHRFDFDLLAAYCEACEQEADALQYRIDHFGTAYNENGCWTYGYVSADERYRELCEQVDAYKTLAEIAEDYYDELDSIHM